jgi:hypothetical protein
LHIFLRNLFCYFLNQQDVMSLRIQSQLVWLIFIVALLTLTLRMNLKDMKFLQFFIQTRQNSQQNILLN